jgi:hypothetical protein
MTVFFAWSRETRSDGGLGWLEAARRANFAAVVTEHRETSASQSAPRQAAASSSNENVDDDEHLAAYNAYLARLNQQEKH